MYVIQYHIRGNGLNRRDKWRPCANRYPTLAEAQAAYDKLPIKAGYRIAEEYMVVRYKAVTKKPSR